MRRRAAGEWLGQLSNGTFLPLVALVAPMAEASAFPRTVAFRFYTLLLILGVSFYVIWGFLYGSWNLFVPDNAGVYAVFVIMVGFGIVGMLLYRKPLQPPPPQ